MASSCLRFLANIQKACSRHVMRKRIRPVRADDEAKGETEGGGRRLDWALQVINTTQAALGQYEASASDWRSSLLLALGGMGRDRSAEAQVAQLRGGSRPDDIPAARISRITDLVVMDRFFTALYNATGNKKVLQLGPSFMARVQTNTKEQSCSGGRAVSTCVAASCALGSRQREPNPPECHRPAHHAPT